MVIKLDKVELMLGKGFCSVDKAGRRRAAVSSVMKMMYLVFTVLFMLIPHAFAVEAGFVKDLVEDSIKLQSSGSFGSCFNKSALYQEVKDTFTVSTVYDNYIVKFDGYYNIQDRVEYLREAFWSRFINNTQWCVLPHTGAANLYPSDFDLIEVDSNLTYQVLMKCFIIDYFAKVIHLSVIF